MKTKPQNYPVDPEHLWNVFFDFTKIPRPSKHEGKVRDYLISIAENKKLKYVVDKAGNVIIYVPGKNGKEEAQPVIIQNHLDMVTDALPGKNINFKEDSLDIFVKDQWLCADGTTLGADNGIGCSAALATIFDESLVHPPLELLFTVDEETGLHGALGLETDYLSAKKMLNLDTEQWGSLYIGCAGGIDYEFNKDLKLVQSEKTNRYKLTLSKLTGGHSGIDIHRQRANAIKLLSEFLFDLNFEVDFDIEEIRAGRAHNIIPRDAFVIIRTNHHEFDCIKKLVQTKLIDWKSYLPECDQQLELLFEDLEDADKKVINNKKELLDFLALFPDGAHAYDLESREQIVSMSNNFARLLVVGDKLYVQSSLRYFDRNEVKSIENKMMALASMIGADVSKNSEYPSWKPTRDGQLLSLVEKTYEELFGKKAEVTAIHAGLECGILKDKIGQIDVVSFGPTITGAHSPDEKVHIPSVESFWKLFKGVLERI